MRSFRPTELAELLCRLMARAKNVAPLEAVHLRPDGPLDDCVVVSQLVMPVNASRAGKAPQRTCRRYITHCAIVLQVSCA